jgi:hypothetical protein
MATKKGSHISGKLGNKIHYVVNGVERIRTTPQHVANPRTPAQQGHRSSFGNISHLSSKMKQASDIGFHHIARRNKTRPDLYFRHINKDCLTTDGNIDYPHIIISHGNVARVEFTDVRLSLKSAAPILHLTFDPCLTVGNADPNDELYLLAFCPALDSAILYQPVLRSAGQLTVTLPAQWIYTNVMAQNNNKISPEQPANASTHLHLNTIHLYAFLLFPGPTPDTPVSDKQSAKNRRGHTSTTIYIPLT